MFKLCKKCSSGAKISDLDSQNPLDRQKIKEGYQQKVTCPVCGSVEYLKEKLETVIQETPYE